MQSIYWPEDWPNKTNALESMEEGDEMFFPECHSSQLTQTMAYSAAKIAREYGNRVRFRTRIERCLVTGDLRGTWIICAKVEFA